MGNMLSEQGLLETAAMIFHTLVSFLTRNYPTSTVALGHVTSPRSHSNDAKALTKLKIEPWFTYQICMDY